MSAAIAPDPRLGQQWTAMKSGPVGVPGHVLRIVSQSLPSKEGKERRLQTESDAPLYCHQSDERRQRMTTGPTCYTVPMDNHSRPTNRLRCQRCGNPLTGRATRWCSPKCAANGYAATHRPARTAANRLYRAKVRAARKGLPAPLTPEQEALADLFLTPKETK